MDRSFVLTPFLVLLLAGCSSSFQGIKMRAQSPLMEEAFQKLSLTIMVDGYRIASVDPAQFRLETQWRDATAKERTDAERNIPAGGMQSRMSLRLERRGMLYDVFLTPYIRYGNTDGSWREVTASVRHPLREKWEKALRTILQVEAKEED
jgi:hypothetical protein